MGSVFSPYYALARRRGRGDPDHHCALNVALYGRSGVRWAMTERGRGAVTRSRASFAIGPSTISLDGDVLTFEIAEVAVPLPRAVRGEVKVRLPAINERVFVLDRQDRHRWWPIAPAARLEVAFDRPAIRWQGSAYLDSNDGDEPLEDAFVRWDWSRAELRDGSAVLYAPELRVGERPPLALRFDRSSRVDEVAPPLPAKLPATLWRVPRTTLADPGACPKVLETFVDAPFYARSKLRSRLFGEDVTAVHESLSLDRFRHPAVQLMLPFRMPRRAR